MRGVIGVALSLLCAGGLPAQIVRGTVTERTSGAPLAGVLLELHRDGSAAATRVASALSDPSGRFALGAPSPGRYSVTAKRIGVQRYASAPFELAAGETRELAIALNALEYRLPEVTVTANGLCAAKPGESLRIASLWEEARTALDATEISLRDRLFTAQVVRYVRELEPGTNRVISETTSETRGLVARPFASLDAESLSTFGYWQADTGGKVIYYGPDAEVLLSPVFLGDHCFDVLTGDAMHHGLVGLVFTPLRSRRVPDIAGTLWLDARTFELRYVDFHYDRVRDGVDASAIGGEVHFAALTNGAWIVRRWFVRVPVLGRGTQPISTQGSAPWILVRPTTRALSEEGGLVTTDELRARALPGSIRGIVRDSGGKAPLPRAAVRLGGTARTTAAGADGAFAFDSVPPGLYSVVVSASGYDSLGLAAGSADVMVTSGAAAPVRVRANNTALLTTALCAGRAAPFGRGTVHLAVHDAVTGASVPGLVVILSWMSTAGRNGIPAQQNMELSTDQRGAAAFCEVASDRELHILIERADGTTQSVEPFKIGARTVRHVDVRVPPGAGKTGGVR